MDAPLQLETYYIEEMHILANPAYKADDKEQNVLDVNIQENKPGARTGGTAPFGIRLTVRVNPKDTDFKTAKHRIVVALVGWFRIASDTGPDIAQALMALNAPSILYGIARGHVAQATAGSPWGRELLPTFNFLAMHQQGRPGPKRKKRPKKAKRRAKKAKA